MRRVAGIIMVLFGLATVITGIWNYFPPLDTTFFPPHAITSFVFGVFLIIHVCFNVKPILRYFKGLGWWWIPVFLGFLAIIWAGALMPVLFY